MAGKIIADIIEAPYDKITLNVGNVTVLSANSSGISNLSAASITANNFVSSNNSFIANNKAIIVNKPSNGGAFSFRFSANADDYYTSINQGAGKGFNFYNNVYQSEYTNQEIVTANGSVVGMFLSSASIKDDSNFSVSIFGNQVKGNNLTSGNGTVGGGYVFRVLGNGQRVSLVSGQTAGNTVYNAYDCRAWVNFNGTGTVAIRSQGNVSSITDRGTGLYRVNFSNSMPDTNYAIVASANPNGYSGAHAGVGGTNAAGDDVNTAYAPIEVRQFDNNGTDSNHVHVAIFR